MLCVNYGFYMAPQPAYFLADPAMPLQTGPARAPLKCEEVPPADSATTVSEPEHWRQGAVPGAPQSSPGRALGLTETDLRQFGEVPKKYWTTEEDQALMSLVDQQGHNWKRISQDLPGRNENQCYGRYRRLLRQVKRGWALEDDHLLRECVAHYGTNWKAISRYFQSIPDFPLDYSSKQIRERYLNHLRPDIQAADWTLDEDLQLCKLVDAHGRKWKLFESQMPGRTENAIKNRYYGYLQRVRKRKSTQGKVPSRKKRGRPFTL